GRLALGRDAELTVEPGALLRVAHASESKSLLVPATLETWDRRLDAALETLDAGAYVDVDFRFFRRLRVAGGPRADLLAQSVHDRLAGLLPGTAAGAGRRSLSGLAVGPRVATELDVTPELAVGASYGEGFRSLDGPQAPPLVHRPYSKVRSVEVG